MPVRRDLAPALLTATLLAGCAAQGDYPSLAIRDAERVTGTISAPETTYTPPAPAPATLAQATDLLAAVRSAHDRFVAAQPAARRTATAARGAGPGSEGWSDAQVAIANLESIRSSAMIAMADLDRLYVDAAVAGEQVESLQSAREAAAALVEQENAVIAELLRLLGG